MANVPDVTREPVLKRDGAGIHLEVEHQFVFAGFDTHKVLQALECDVQTQTLFLDIITKSVEKRPYPLLPLHWFSFPHCTLLPVSPRSASAWSF